MKRVIKKPVIDPIHDPHLPIWVSVIANLFLSERWLSEFEVDHLAFHIDVGDVALVLLPYGEDLFLWSDEADEVGLEFPVVASSTSSASWEVFDFDKSFRHDVDGFDKESEVADIGDEDVKLWWIFHEATHMEILKHLQAA